MRGNLLKVTMLAGTLLFICGNVFVVKAEAGNVTNERMKVKQQDYLHQVSTKNRENIRWALESCEKNGAQTARRLNKIKNNKRDFENGVRCIMDEYYSMEKSERRELEDFEEMVDVSAQTIMQHYEEAEKERENSENLNYQTEEIIVRFPYGTSKEKIDKVVGEAAVDYEIIDSGELHIDDSLPDYKKKRLAKIKDYKTDVVILARLGLEDTVARAEEKFENYGCVVDASENLFLEADGTIATPNGEIALNDPYFNENSQWNMKVIDVPRASYELCQKRSATEIWVAVIDCGVQMNHPDLKGNLLTSYSVDVTQDPKTNKKLINCVDRKATKGQYTGSHGTMVAGVIVAKANNRKLGAGVASAASEECFGSLCKVMAIKCDDTVGSGRHITKGYLAKAINYAVAEGAEVINISYSALKGDFNANTFKDVENAIKRAIAADVCVIASAGNDGSSKLRYPAAFKGVIGVGATQQNNRMTAYSNRSSAVDIVAPGGEDGGKKILSTYPTTIKASGYNHGRGTSYAAPQVAGTVALMKSIHYELTPTQVLSKLKSGSTVAVKVKVGNGTRTYRLLNAGGAVRLAR